MKKIKISLATAFSVRSTLVKQINKYAVTVGSREQFVFREDVELANERFITGSFMGDWTKYCKLLDSKRIVNDAIEAANIKGQQLLNRIAFNNAVINQVESIKTYNRMAERVTRRDNPVSGLQERIPKVSVIGDENYANLLVQSDRLAKEKLRLDRELSEHNSSTLIEFEIEDEIADLLGLA